MNLESGYSWLKVRRPGLARAIKKPINGFGRTGMRSRILMLLPIEGQKIEGIGPSAFEERIRDREAVTNQDVRRDDHSHQFWA